jgi:hypothetical protein
MDHVRPIARITAPTPDLSGDRDAPELAPGTARFHGLSHLGFSVSGVLVRDGRLQVQ